MSVVVFRPDKEFAECSPAGSSRIESRPLPRPNWNQQNTTTTEYAQPAPLTRGLPIPPRWVPPLPGPAPGYMRPTKLRTECCGAACPFLEEEELDDFSQRLATHAQSLRVGDPADPETEVGSLINERQMRRVLHYIHTAKDEGARIITGGSRVGTVGYFIDPTVFVASNRLTIVRVGREEIYGPVWTIIWFDDDDEVLNMANSSEYGLTAVL